jgi:hypothetical protein
MSNAQIVAAYAAIVITPCAVLIVFQWLLNRHDDRKIRREMDKARHPSMRMRSDVRVLRLTVDDFNGCDECHSGIHGVKMDNGRCLCCYMILPNSYTAKD